MSNLITQRPSGPAAPTAADEGLLGANGEPDDSAATLGGDPGAELAALTVKAGVAERRTARAMRDAQEQLAEREDAQQVQAMHDGASSLRTQAWFDGGMTVASVAVGSQTTLGTLVAAGNKVGDGLFAADQQDDAATAKAHEAAAGQAENAVKDASDAASEGDELVRSGLQFYSTYIETRAQTMAAALHKA